MNVIKGPWRILESFLRGHSTTLDVHRHFYGESTESKVQFHETHLKWTSMGYRRDEHYSEENIKPPANGNIRKGFLKKQCRFGPNRVALSMNRTGFWSH